MLISIIKFQWGEFFDAKPNWFDWLSLITSSIVSAGSIFGAYWIAKYVYSKEKRDKKAEHDSLLDSEVSLFRNNIDIINNPLSNQIEILDGYIEKKSWEITLRPEISIDFLQFINVKNIYLYYGFNNKNSIEIINGLMTSLYSIHDFKSSIKGELITYQKFYREKENAFYLYRQLLYTKFYELKNRNTIKNQFIDDYEKLLMNTFSNEKIIKDNTLISRELLVSEFIEPLSLICSRYLNQLQAVEVIDITNQVYAAFKDMEAISNAHFESIVAYNNRLKSTKEKIDKWLLLQKD